MKRVAVLVVLLLPTVALGGGAPRLITDLAPGPADAGINSLRAAGTTVVFRRQALDLWRSDATEAGTFMLLNEVTSNLTTHGDRVDFTSTTPPDDALWSTDGTVDGTTLVATLPATTLCTPFGCNTGSANPNSLTPAGDLLFFLENTWTVWRSDGTTPGSAQIANYSQQACSTGCLCCFLLGGTLTPPVPVNERVYYSGLDFFGEEMELFVAGVFEPRIVMPGDGILAFRGVRGRLFIATRGARGTTLSTRDTLTTRPVAILGDGSLQPTQLTAAGGLLYLVLGEGTATPSLWRSDGTPGGTFKLLDAAATQLTAVGSRLFFRRLAEQGDELWTSDGTAAGTMLVVDLPPSHLTGVSEDLFFVASDAETGEELWRSDGTPGGTAPVADIVAGPDGSAPADLTAACGRVYFTATTPTTGRELYALDLDPGVCSQVDQSSCTSDRDCDDGIPCTTDTCDPSSGCTATPSHAACNDGIPCTDDLCNPAIGCTAIAIHARCDDENSCTTDVCDRFSGCRSTPGPDCGAAVCPGDCNRDGSVGISELVLAVNIALERVPLAQCPALDRGCRCAIHVTDLVGAVNSVLNGCRA